ncbi:MAG: hypothetical protein R2704_07550 [Microthrixaceae bacterium]
MQRVQPVVEIVQRSRHGRVPLGVGLHGQPVQPCGLLAHRRDQAAQARRDRDAVDPPGCLGDVDRQVARALDLRHHADGRHDRPHVAGHRLLEGQHPVARLLHLHHQRIEHIVVVDDQLGLGQVDRQQRLGHPRDRLGDQRRHRHQLIGDLVQIIVKVLADVLSVGHGANHPTFAQLVHPNRPVM